MIETKIIRAFCESFKELFDTEIETEKVNIQKTRAEVEGDYTINVFPFVRFARKSPEQTAELLGKAISAKVAEIESFNVIKGFLNFCIADKYWINVFKDAAAADDYGFVKPDKKERPVLIEYSSPNTNKPLHLGHIRNNLLGWSIAEILKASGVNAVKVNLVNDRGIHICKSMLAWERWGKGETPETSGMKGDHLVGKYYVMFDQRFKTEVKNMVDRGTLEENAVKQSELLKDARKMLKMWEEKDEYVTKLWIKMNEWVCSGFEETYKRMGVDFDKVYYESDTYLLGKEIVRKGFEDGTFFKKDDGSIWVDLTDEGLDQKLLLRADGTSVYITQDLGTAQLRYKDFNPTKMLYVVGNEQNYHFEVLRLILKKLGYKYWNDIVHISYGMVELPEGKMKSREGTVVDADDLMDEMTETAARTTTELGKAGEMDEQARKVLFEQIGLGALKYFILKVDPKKTMLFNPKESIDFNGNTGPFIQYTHARICSLLSKAGKEDFDFDANTLEISEKEKDLLVLISQFPKIIRSAADSFSPALVANYVYNMAKEYNQFYQKHSVLKEENAEKRNFRILLSKTVRDIIRKSLGVMGIAAPERM